MDSIKLACDAASITACVLADYMNDSFDYEKFTKTLKQNFPKEVAEHIELIVCQVINYEI